MSKKKFADNFLAMKAVYSRDRVSGREARSSARHAVAVSIDPESEVQRMPTQKRGRNVLLPRASGQARRDSGRSHPKMPLRRLPKPRKEQRGLLLPIWLWDALSKDAEFVKDAYKQLGLKESVSRNDMIEFYLLWAHREFWAERGGPPTTERDRQEKVSRHAAELAEELKKGEQ